MTYLYIHFRVFQTIINELLPRVNDVIVVEGKPQDGRFLNETADYKQKGKSKRVTSQQQLKETPYNDLLGALIHLRVP